MKANQELGRIIMMAVTKLFSDISISDDFSKVDEKGNRAIELLGRIQAISGSVSNHPNSWQAFSNAHEINGCLEEKDAYEKAKKNFEEQRAIYGEGERLRTQWDAIQNGTKNDPQLEKDWKRFLATVRLMDGLK
jgi:hypothetical protein